METNDHSEYIITGKDSLNILFTKRRKRYRKFNVQVKGMDDIKAKNFENDLNKFHASCGCTTGNYFLSTTIILSFVYITFTKQTLFNWKIVIQVFFIYLFAAFIGKLIGKLMDSYKFKKTIVNLYHELEKPKSF